MRHQRKKTDRKLFSKQQQENRFPFLFFFFFYSKRKSVLLQNSDKGSEVALGQKHILPLLASIKGFPLTFTFIEIRYPTKWRPGLPQERKLRENVTDLLYVSTTTIKTSKAESQQSPLAKIWHTINLEGTWVILTWGITGCRQTVLFIYISHFQTAHFSQKRGSGWCYHRTLTYKKWKCEESQNCEFNI